MSWLMDNWYLFTEYREDGWPLCPRCQADELWSPNIPATATTIHGCLACGWMAPPWSPPARMDTCGGVADVCEGCPECKSS